MHSQRVRLALVSLALSSLACGGMTAGSQVSRADSGPGWLAWSVDASGAAHTIWLDPNGRPIADREGLVIAAGDELVEVRRDVESVMLPTCEDVELGRAASGGGETGMRTRLTQVSLATGARQALIEPLEVGAAASLRHDIVPVASLGPYLFARESADVFACGAHGNVEVAMRTLDLRSGEPIDLVAPGEETLRERARATLLVEGQGAIDEPLEPDAVRRVATIPVLENGTFVAEHVLTAEACYACGDGEWSSYTRATRIRDARLPETLQPYALVPPAIARWLAAHPEVRGISSAPDALLSRFESSVWR